MSGWTIVESQVDWLTCTSADAVNRPKLRRLAEALARDEIGEGNQAEPMARRGYTGWQCGRVSLGERPADTLLEVQGALAEQAIDRAAPLWSNVSRVDFAVTARPEPAREGIAWDAYQTLKHSPPRRGFRLDGGYHESISGGQTCYVGSRSSDYYGRIYDKAKQSHKPDYLDCWRWECECKGKPAKALAVAYCGAAKRAAVCQGYVHFWYTKRGLRPDWPADANCLHCPSEPRRTDAARRLAWLASQVRPAVSWLRAEGWQADASTALGLDLAAAPLSPMVGRSEAAIRQIIAAGDYDVIDEIPETCDTDVAARGSDSAGPVRGIRLPPGEES